MITITKNEKNIFPKEIKSLTYLNSNTDPLKVILKPTYINNDYSFLNVVF